jgi:hypothetical protein
VRRARGTGFVLETPTCHRHRARRDAGIPIVISFSTEIDGRLSSGETLAGAISKTDHVERLPVIQSER